MFRTKEISAATGLKNSALHVRASVLPMESEARPRGARRWTLQDSVLLLAAQSLSDEGFPVQAALAFAAAIAPEVVPMVADEERVTILVGWPDPATDAGWSCTLRHTKGDAVDLVMEHPGAIIVQPRLLIRAALETLLTLKRAERANA